MIYDDFEILIGSPFDKENLICEIYYKNQLFAEISQEEIELHIELYPPEGNQVWNFPLHSFQNILKKAEEHLIGKEKD